MRKFGAWIGAIIITLGIGGTALAANQSQKTVTLGASQTVNGDYMTAASAVQISGTVNGDVFVAGGTVDVDGTVNGDVLAAGGVVNITGTVTGNVRAVGGTVTISGTVDRNVTVSAGTLTVERKAVIKGNILSATGHINVSGTVNGNVSAASGTFDLVGTVNGKVDTRLTSLMVSPDASVGGDLTYTSSNSADINPAAKISGVVLHKLPAASSTPTFVANWGFVFWKLLTMLLLGLTLLWLFPRFALKTADLVLRKPGHSAWIGLAGLILVPILSIILMITVLGIPLGIILFGLYVLAIIVGELVVALLFGQWVSKALKFSVGPKTAFLAGALIYWVLALLPFVGGIFTLVVTVVGFGAVLQSAQALRQAKA